MIVQPQIAIIKWNCKTRKHYLSKGYQYTKLGDDIKVNVMDLTIGSCSLIDVECDFCKIIFKNGFKYAINAEYHSCSKCRYNKVRQTNLKNLGVEYVFQSENFKIKSKETNLEKFGTENASQSEEIRNKMKKTCLKNYGVDNPYQINREDKIKKIKQTMYANNSAPCSTQQRYISNLLDGKLNYPIDTCSLDIAFLEEKIYIEYDGSGHDLSIKFGFINEQQFKIKEYKRQYSLKNMGWSLIRIVSKKDYLPSDEIIFNLIEECKDYLFNENHSWIIIDIDKSEIRSSKLNKTIELGELRKIKKRD